ncbi:putative aarF domain-containing protein kinase [Chlorella vulgaris]
MSIRTSLLSRLAMQCPAAIQFRVVAPTHRQWVVPRRAGPLAVPHRGLLPVQPARSFAAASGRLPAQAVVWEDDLPYTIYTPAANADYWRQRPVAVTKRGIEIAAAFASYMMEGRLTNRGATKQELTNVQADKLRQLLTQLGPAFVKIGQAVSSRPDVAPPEFLRELEKLQDQIPPFCNDEAFAVIQTELGVPVSQAFSSISPQAVAAASLGQVYRAVRRDTGEAVAVKVQRPGVTASIALDVYILRQVLSLVRRWRKFNSDLPALLDEWASSLFRELDYRHEAANGTRFRELYGHLEGVYVPRMHAAMCTRKVLVMEWVEGERLRTAYSAAREGVAGGGQAAIGVPGGTSDDLRLVEVGVRCSLEQMLEDGFYHADPHPGNLLRTPDGKLAYLDFGMVGEVDATIRRGLMRATLHLVNREFEALADDFVTLGMLPKAEGEEKGEVTAALTSVFAEALKGGVSNLSFGELSGQLGRTMYNFQFQIPPFYTLLVRSLSVLEGIALASDPNYKVLGAAYPWVARRLLTDTTPELRSTLMSLLYKDGRFNFRRMESLISQAVRPTGRPQPRRNSGSAVQRGDALALLLSPEGEFVRGIVTEELAKGIDAAWRLAADTAVGTVRQELLSVSLDSREALGGGGVGAEWWQAVLLMGVAMAVIVGLKISAPQPATETGTVGSHMVLGLHTITSICRAVKVSLPALPAGATFGGLSGGSLLVHALAEALSELPRLSDERDQEQVDGITRLAAVLQVRVKGTSRRDSGKNGESTVGKRQQQGGDWFQDPAAAGRTGGGSPLESAFASLKTAGDILSWVVTEAETLAPAERAEALRLPISIGQAVASRAAARTIRWLLVGEAMFNSSANNASEAAAAAERAARTARAAGGSAGFSGASASSPSNAATAAANSGDASSTASPSTVSSSTVSPSPSTSASSSTAGSVAATPVGVSASVTSSSNASQGRRPATVMVPLSPTSSRPGSNVSNFRASGSPGSAVIVRPTGTIVTAATAVDADVAAAAAAADDRQPAEAGAKLR